MYFQVEKKNRHLSCFPFCALSSTPHIHEHIEIVLMKTGSTLAVADKKQALIEAGDLYISMPNQVHYYLDQDSPLQGNLLILSPEICPEFRQIFKGYIPTSPCLKNVSDYPAILPAMEKIQSLSKSSNLLDENARKGYALILFSELFRSMPMEAIASCDYNTVKNILNFCYENYMAPITLSSISRELHLSRYYISHIFSERLHISFNKYINALRIRKACEMLKQEDCSVTEIGYEVGYNCTRTFNRCFMEETGVTPKEYRMKLFN